MNCSQARALLAEYRELKNGQAETTELDDHLAVCSECKQFLIEQNRIGMFIRSLPSIEPSAQAHTRLMQALASEHMQYTQQTTISVTPPPAFLKPYIKEQAQRLPNTQKLTAFSTADTGPLPIVQMSRQRPHLQHLNPMAIVGLAAAFLMVVMMGGLTSLLLLTHNGLSSVGDTASINNFVQVSRTSYTTSTPYTHVISAIANRNSIYYTAYGDGSTGWMLEEFDTRSNFSIPLLSTESSTPLIVLGNSQNWLVWLQLDSLKPINADRTSHHITQQERTWSLHALNLDTQGQTSINPASPITLLKDTFNQSTAPGWINNPVQGICFTQNSLLVTALDAKGTSHLWHFSLDQLDAKKAPIAVMLAQASDGHILTSPTANNNGTTIYWSEEWRADDTTLHSNIWVQQTSVMQPGGHGRWVPRTETTQSLFSSDGMSFHPQMVNDALFYLSTNPQATTNTGPDGNSTATTTAAATAANTPEVTPQATHMANQTVTTDVDTTITAPPADAGLQGTLLALYPEATQPTAMDASGQDSMPQGGTRFILWQNSSKGLEMYDVATRTPVTIKDVVPRDASFLTVNGESAIWTLNTNSSTSSSALQGPTVTFSAFNWPDKLSVKS